MFKNNNYNFMNSENKIKIIRIIKRKKILRK